VRRQVAALQKEMHYREIRPKPPLSDYVECFWVLQGDGQVQSSPERLLPDGCVELILNFGDPFNEHIRETGLTEVQPLRFIVGQMTRPVLISPSGRIDVVGVRFAPGGALPFIRIPLKELTDSTVTLSDIDPALDREIAECPNPELVESLLTRLLASRNLRSSEVRYATSCIVNSNGRVPVDQLAHDTGISGRQLERRFLREVGLPPKLLSRILRFQQVFRAVEHPGMNWAAVAVDCGYFDQAHLIRDFRQFAGRTPSVQFEDFTRFSEMFTRKHRS